MYYVFENLFNKAKITEIQTGNLKKWIEQTRLIFDVPVPFNNVGKLPMEIMCQHVV